MEHATSSLRARRKKSSIRLPCCFNGRRHHHHHRSNPLDLSSSSPASLMTPSSRRSPSTWISSKTPDEIKNFLCRRIGRHRRRHTADFSYDPLSYALNFEDEHDQDYPAWEAEEFPVRSFAARLPLSPPPRSFGLDGIEEVISTKGEEEISSGDDVTSRNGDGGGRAKLPTRAAMVAEVRKSLEGVDITSPRSVTRRPKKILVQTC